jgi:hypothetical protein
MIVIIKRKWLPTTLPLLAVWFANFSMKFAEVSAGLGFKPADIAAVENANSTVQWLNDAMGVLDANAAAFRSFRDQLLYGEKNDAQPAVPATNLPSAPADYVSSIVQWLDRLKEKIELAENYTPDIGAQLGFVAPAQGGISEENVKPTLKVFAAVEDYLFSVVVEGRGKSDQNELQYRVMGQEKFDSLLKFTGKATDAQYKPSPEGAPVKIEVRIQLYRRNEKYGQPSDPVYITLNP